jgi:(p)ppGpp synthase/HD superfamily hydrolase
MKIASEIFEEKYKSIIDLIGKNIKQDITANKPLIPHLLRVGKYLYQNNYSEDVIVAGLLHDLIEWTDNPEEIIEQQYGKHVYDIVLANTKDRSIADAGKRREDYVNRCAKIGIDALIVKAADTLDSYNYYKQTGNLKEIARSKNIADLILEKVKISDDQIFKELSLLI